MIDTMGTGIRRIFQQQRARYLPLPEYDLSDTDRVVMTIFGRQIDENYGRILMERKDLSIAEIVVLDRIQKKQVVDKDAARQLRSKRLVTGRYPDFTWQRMLPGPRAPRPTTRDIGLSTNSITRIS